MHLCRQRPLWANRLRQPGYRASMEPRYSTRVSTLRASIPFALLAGNKLSRANAGINILQGNSN